MVHLVLHEAARLNIAKVVKAEVGDAPSTYSYELMNVATIESLESWVFFTAERVPLL